MVMCCTWSFLTAADRKAAAQAHARLDLIQVVPTQGVCAADHTDHVSKGTSYSSTTILQYYTITYVLLVLRQELGVEGVRQT